MAKDIPTETFTIPDGTILEPVVAGYLAQDGDSYASIAAANPVKGQTLHQTARALYLLNNGKPIYPGTNITI